MPDYSTITQQYPALQFKQCLKFCTHTVILKKKVFRHVLQNLLLYDPFVSSDTHQWYFACTCVQTCSSTSVYSYLHRQRHSTAVVCWVYNTSAMNENIYDDVKYTEELKCSEHATVNIFANTDARCYSTNTESANGKTMRNLQVQHTGT